jgi:phosphate-selective porin OprO/OprP
VRNERFARIRTVCLSALLTVPLLSSAKAADNEPPGARWTFDELRPTVTSADGRFSLSLRARLQLDAGGFNQSSDVDDVSALHDVEFKHLGSGALVRRAYLGLEGAAFRDFWYEYRMNFGGDGFRIADPYIHIARISYNLGSYEAGPLLRINAGLIKPVFTHNDATSSASLTFLERAAVVNVATETYGGGAPRLGAELTFQQTDLFRAGDNLMVSGAFTGHVASKRASEISSDANSNGTHLLGRIAYRLWSDGVSNIQIGGDVSRVLTVGGAPGPGGARSLSLQDEPEIQIDGNALVDTGPLPAKGGGLWGIEAAGNLRSVYFAAEYYEFSIERDTSCGGCVVAGDPEFSGWYVESSWILTGETKTYQANARNNGMATFANPEVAAPFDPYRGSWGAWEVAARYSDLDLDWQPGALGTTCPVAGCVRGGEQKIFALGLNWYLSNNFRVLIDYMFIHVDKLSGLGAQIGQDVTVLGTRFQFTN